MDDYPIRSNGRNCLWDSKCPHTLLGIQSRRVSTWGPHGKLGTWKSSRVQYANGSRNLLTKRSAFLHPHNSSISRNNGWYLCYLVVGCHPPASLPDGKFLALRLGWQLYFLLIFWTWFHPSIEWMNCGRAFIHALWVDLETYCQVPLHTLFIRRVGIK